MEIFENVANLVASKLKAGTIVETKGYHTAGDGGGAKYLIQTSGTGETLANGNVAVKQQSFNLPSKGKIAPTVFNPKEPCFAFQFDGTYTTNLTTLVDKADELNVKVGIGWITRLVNGADDFSVFDDPNFATVDQVVSAAKRGHEIYNHGTSDSVDMSPTSNLSERSLKYHVDDSFYILKSLGITPVAWITSNGKPVVDQTLHLKSDYIPHILRTHKLVFGRTSTPWNDASGFEGSSIGEGTPLNTEGLTRANVEGVTFDQFKSFVDWCIDNNRCAVFTGHDSGNSGQLTVAEFEQYVNYIQSKGKKVVTTKQLFETCSDVFVDQVDQDWIPTPVHENLLDNTDIRDWEIAKEAGIGSASIVSWGEGRSTSEQFTVTLSDPTIINNAYIVQRTINRPFGVVDGAALTASLRADTTDDIGVEIILRFYDAEDAGGNLVATTRKGVVGGGKLETISSNFFNKNTVQSVTVRYEFAAKTLWSGAKTVSVYNPCLSRGVGTPPFIKKRPNNVLWKGNVGVVGTFSLTKPIPSDAKALLITAGVNNSNQDARGTVVMGVNFHEVATIKAYGGTAGSINTEFTLKLVDSSTVEILTETVVGGGDFAIIRVEVLA